MRAEDGQFRQQARDLRKSVHLSILFTRMRRHSMQIVGCTRQPMRQQIFVTALSLGCFGFEIDNGKPIVA